ncbi:hypothetical protein IWX78_000478 [Mycetocola sp. CAN_C7]|uniref:alpha-1,2-fucosyltransferase n=1 Tax=Mycetocola sp. CAN_C7 TaxID=2787724 RepID=UPI0018CB7BA3
MRWRVKDDEILLTLQGGLGNQLFEWAFAHDLERSGRRVLIDRVRCRGDRPLVIEPLLTSEQRFSQLSGLLLAVAQRRGRISDSSALRLVKQKKSGHDVTVRERLTGRSYLMGYFQSPHYFTASADSVRASITGLLDSMLTPSGRALAEELAADPHTVAVHVRRGDYLAVADNTARHGVLGQDYYDRALAHLDVLGHRNRVWFGDDPDWMTANLVREGDRVCPADATTQDGGEIALMSACSSKVIANSTFSWWAGWLGKPATSQHPVIAPATWFADAHSDASELVPPEWLRF